MTPDPLLSERQTSAALNLSTATLRRWRRPAAREMAIQRTGLRGPQRINPIPARDVEAGSGAAPWRGGCRAHP